MIPDAALIMAHGSPPSLPHIDQLKSSNPRTPLHVIVGADSGNGKAYDWKNSDQQLRAWWKGESERVAGEVVAILEWDTLVEKQLPDLPDDMDLAGATVIRRSSPKPKRRTPMLHPDWTPENWWWWREEILLEGLVGVGLVSFGCMVIRRKFLDAVCEQRWDSVFSKSIQNELRFPSVVQGCGGRIGQIDLPGVIHKETKRTGDHGIWHAIKPD